jgi:hypothetical protein
LFEQVFYSVIEKEFDSSPLEEAVTASPEVSDPSEVRSRTVASQPHEAQRRSLTEPVGHSHDADVFRNQGDDRTLFDTDADIDRTQVTNAELDTHVSALGRSPDVEVSGASVRGSRESHPTASTLAVGGDGLVPQSHTFRRVAIHVPVLLRQHRPVAGSFSDATGDVSSKSSPVQGVSAFLGRVLNQLSLSAWLPAAMLVGSLALLVQLHAQKNRNVDEAVTRLTNKPLGILILLLFAIVLATLVTQAFEFEVIRILEGYWGSGPVSHAMSRVFIRRQLQTQTRLLDKHEMLQVQALHEAELPAGKDRLVEYIEREIR